MNSVWLKIFLWKRFEETLEQIQWMKSKQMQPVWLYKRLYLLWVWPKCFPDTFESTQWREFRNFFHFKLAFIFNTNDSFKWKIDHCPGMLTPHKEKYTASSTRKYAFIMTCAIFVFVVSWTWRLFVALSFHVYIHVYCHLCLIASATDVSLLCRYQRKKRDYVGKIPKRRPPPTHPPSLGNPCYQKKKLGLFVILGPQEHFWSSAKNHHFGW